MRRFLILCRKLFTAHSPRLKFFRALRAAAVCLAAIFALAAVQSCRTVNCDRCGGKSGEDSEVKLDTIYVVEFKQGFKLSSKVNGNKQSFLKSCFYPRINEFYTEDGIQYTITVVEDYSNRSVSDGQSRFLQLIEARDKGKLREESTTYHLKDTSVIRRITMSSDPDVPPVEVPVRIENCLCCKRDRNCIREKTGFIDKMEFRAVGGYRLGTLDGVYYPNQSGGVFYEKETFGFGRGGTDFTVGAEISTLWIADGLIDGIFSIPEENHFYLGLMLGVWPVDGSVFVPVSLHPRYTFARDVADRANGLCDAWYVFGDIGVPFDPTFALPVLCDRGKCEGTFSYLWGLGVGRDWWMTRCFDFSVDLGFRSTRLPLPKNEFCMECSGSGDAYPFRTSHQLFLRFGYTW